MKIYKAISARKEKHQLSKLMTWAGFIVDVLGVEKESMEFSDHTKEVWQRFTQTH